MKKSLLALASIACLGLFAVGCEDENGGCENHLDCVGSVNGNYCINGACSHCSIACTGDTTCKDTGNGTYDCVANNNVHEEPCESNDECMDKGYVCYKGYCTLESEVPAEDVKYHYVRIDDLSPVETNSKKEDPGVDIDAIVVTKGDGSGTPIYATKVQAYARGEGWSNVDKLHAFDSASILGAPDSFASYPTSTETCNYYKDGKKPANNDDENREYTFVSLGGLGGYIVVEMGGEMAEGDKLTILEVSDCKLANTMTADGQSAVAEKDGMKVQVSVSEGNDASWQTVASGVAKKGILSGNIPAVK